MAHVHLGWFVYKYTVGQQDVAYSIVRVKKKFLICLYDDHTVSNTLQQKRQSMATSDEELGGARLRMPCLQILVILLYRAMAPLYNYYRPYPRTCNCESTSFTSGWQIAKGGKGALFYSRIAVNDGKGRRVQ